MYEYEKPHWTLRSTKAKHKAKAKCLFDILFDVALALYTFGLFAWIFLDAFNF